MNYLRLWLLSALLIGFSISSFSQGSLFTQQPGPYTTKGKSKFKNLRHSNRQSKSITGLGIEGAKKDSRTKRKRTNTTTAFANEVFVDLLAETSNKPYSNRKYSQVFNPIKPGVSKAIRKHPYKKRSL